MTQQTPEDLWTAAVGSALADASAEERLKLAVARVRAFHDATGYQRLFGEPLVPTDGATEQDLRDLERDLGSPLPREYRAFLNLWRHLILSDGYRIWGVGNATERPYIDLEISPGTPYLVCGDVWHDADGDPLLLSLSDPDPEARVWSHDLRKIRHLGSTFSLGLSRLVEFLFPAPMLEGTVALVRESVESQLHRRAHPWRFW